MASSPSPPASSISHQQGRIHGKTDSGRYNKRTWRERKAPVNLLTIWGDPSNRSSYTIDLFPLADRFAQVPVRQVLVYAANYLEAVDIAKREGLAQGLEPRHGGLERLN